jgi:hypothetical protein
LKPILAPLLFLLCGPNCGGADDDDTTTNEDDAVFGGPSLDLPSEFAWCPSGGGGSGDGTLTVGMDAIY